MKITLEDSIWFIDIQTTGTKPSCDAIIEIAWTPPLSIRDLANSDTFPVVLNRFVRLPPEFQANEKIFRRLEKLSGLKLPELLRNLENAQTPQEIWQEIEESHNSKLRLHPDLKLQGIHTSHCVIHFAQFEMLFQSQLTGKQIFPGPVLCTFKLAQMLLPNLQSKSLRSVAGRFGHYAGEFKQARNHVEATVHLFRSILNQYYAGPETRVESILSQSAERKSQSSSKKRAPRVSHAQTSLISHDARLRIPDRPGIYRFIGPGHTTLYIGKATSLKSRVNSYFRGQKPKGSRLSEMILQAHAIGTLELESVIQASVLETMLIARLDPPYNRALRERNKEPGYFLMNHEQSEFWAMSSSELQAVLQSSQEWPGQNFARCYGPYPNANALKEKLAFLKAALLNSRIDSNQEVFYFSQESISGGMKLFFDEFGLQEETAIKSLPGIARKLLRERLSQVEAKTAPDLDTESAVGSLQETNGVADDAANCFNWIKGLLRSLLCDAIRGKRLQILGHASIAFFESAKEHALETRDGKITIDPSTMLMHTSDPVLEEFKETLKIGRFMPAQRQANNNTSIDAGAFLTCRGNGQKPSLVYDLDSYNAVSALLAELLRKKGDRSSRAPVLGHIIDLRSNKTWLPGSFLSPLWRTASRKKHL